MDDEIRIKIMQRCQSYNIDCPYALSNNPTIPCFGNFEQCKNWRENLSNQSNEEKSSKGLRFWVSWCHPENDCRPLNCPPNEKIIGWWNSGYNENDECIVCALINAKDEFDMYDAVLQEWPEANNRKWRFVEEVSDFWMPNARFPLSDWMKERI